MCPQVEPEDAAVPELPAVVPRGLHAVSEQAPALRGPVSLVWAPPAPPPGCWVPLLWGVLSVPEPEPGVFSPPAVPRFYEFECCVCRGGPEKVRRLQLRW